MKETEILVVGGGPAGLSASIEAARAGAKVLIIDDGLRLGGQLVKQTHKFFGSKEEYAGTRGFKIADLLLQELEEYKDRFEAITNTTVTGYYADDGVFGALTGEEKYFKVKPKKVVIATGAYEKTIPVPNCDLPGVYGAGAVQTLMNVYGVKPGEKALMVGAGNIGLIISYQLAQAGVKVQAVVEAMPKIGGYLVHASKIRRIGIPIYTSHTVKEIHGEDCVEGATIVQVDERWEFISGTEKYIEADLICLAVGLSPLIELLWQAGCKMRYIPELGGYVPVRNKEMRTSHPDFYVAGDAAAIEEASTAMIEGRIAGLCAAASLGYKLPDFEERFNKFWMQLEILRKGPVTEKIRQGLPRATVEGVQEYA
ncbi:MAG: NAD(P)/FAD-dependent oxidoreductase [Synergistetes bacterium]|nr:NAD(P)/FAD-dependent oxidoreductase [Synergistota bacterium]